LQLKGRTERIQKMDKEEKEKRVTGLTYIVNRIRACRNDNDIMVIYL